MPDTKKYLDIDGLTEYHESAGHSADIADGSITAAKLATAAVTFDKITPSAISRIQAASLIAADSQADQALTALNLEHRTLTPAQMLANNEYANSTNRLCWTKGTFLEAAHISFVGDLQSGQITLYAKGMGSTASGKLGIDTSWEIID